MSNKRFTRFVYAVAQADMVTEILEEWNKKYINIIDWKVVCDTNNYFWVFGEVFVEEDKDA